jgi:hypothetical protein
MDAIAALIRLDRIVREAQAALRENVLPGGPSDEETIRTLREILEDEDFTRFQRDLEDLDRPEAEKIGSADPLPYR